MFILSNRLKVALKRKVFEAFGFPSVETISLYRKKSPSIPSRIVADYAPMIPITINDPRSTLDVGHFFNSRAIREIHDVILEPTQALLYSPSGKIISESTSWPSANVASSFPWKPRKSRRENIDSGIPLSSSSYYHWLMEDLPGTISALNINSDFPLLISKTAPSYVLDFIKVSNRPHRLLKNPANVRKLIITEKQTDTGWPHPRDIETLEQFRDLHLPSKKEVKTKIYISRRFSKRSPRNEADVELLFEDFGFQVIYSERMDFLSQIEVCKQASYIAGIHGAGLSNMVFANPGCKVLEIANANWWNECFHRLAFLKKHQYNHFLYEGKIDDALDLKKLKSRLTEIGYDKE